VIWPAGVSVRSAARDDLDQVVALLRGAELVDSGRATWSREEVDADWNRLGFDLGADARVFFTDGDLVAYAETVGGRLWGTVAPHARGRGLGTALLRWQEERAREQARMQGATGMLLGQTLADSAHGAIALLQAHGYTALYSAWSLQLPSEIDLSATAPPADIRFRQMQAGEGRSIYEVIERAFNESPGRAPQSFEVWRAATVGRPDFDPCLTFVAVGADGTIVGAAIGIEYPDGGWVQQLAVVAEQRGRGIARALLGAVFGALRGRGLTSLGLSTDSRTGALDLYRRLGMVVERSFKHWSKWLV